MTQKILLLPGDGIGPEITAAAEKVLHKLIEKHQLDIELEHGLIGGASIDVHSNPLTDETLQRAHAADAILLGAVGGKQEWNELPLNQRPEKGLLRLRSELDLFANLRPAKLFAELSGASSLKSEVVSGLDILIVRELVGGIYFGKPRGTKELENGEKAAFNTLVYSESEIARIAHTAFKAATGRNQKVCSIDKANVLESSVLWREVFNQVSLDYPDVELSHMFIDNAVMQLIANPKQFDVIASGNLFGDILSDAAAQLVGSIGMLPSASLDKNGKGMYEPIHGSAPDIAGENKANPLATILSVAMLLRHSLNNQKVAAEIESAVSKLLADGYRTADIYTSGCKLESTSRIADKLINYL